MRRPASGKLRIIKRFLANRTGQAYRQLACGIHVAKQYIGQGVTGLDAGAPRLKNGGHMGGGPLEFERPAGQHHQDHRLAGGYDGL